MNDRDPFGNPAGTVRGFLAITGFLSLIIFLGFKYYWQVYLKVVVDDPTWFYALVSALVGNYIGIRSIQAIKSVYQDKIDKSHPG